MNLAREISPNAQELIDAGMQFQATLSEHDYLRYMECIEREKQRRQLGEMGFKLGMSKDFKRYLNTSSEYITASEIERFYEMTMEIAAARMPRGTKRSLELDVEENESTKVLVSALKRVRL